MTRQEFETCMKLLIETYTDRAYPAPRVARIWAWAKKANGQTFAEAVDNAIGDSHQAPLLSKLRDYYAEVRAKHPEREKIKCDYCDGGGFILSFDIMPLAYRCRCEAGQQVPEYVPKWLGPWNRIVPRKDEMGRVAIEALIGQTMKGIE